MGKFNHLWNHRLDGDNKQARSFLRVVIVALTLLVAFFLLKKDNIIRWIESGITIRRQERQIEYYQKEIEDLRRRVEDMTSDTVRIA